MTPTATFYRSGNSSQQKSIHMSPYAKNQALLSALSKTDNSKLSTNVHTHREGYSNPVSAFRPEFSHQKINLSPGAELVFYLYILSSIG
jgi:hypothetical protein